MALSDLSCGGEVAQVQGDADDEPGRALLAAAADPRVAAQVAAVLGVGRRGAHLVDLAKAEAGHEYKLVITADAGLNRYLHVGDILPVTGFHKTTTWLLSIDSVFDKIDEAELECAVERASTLLRPHSASVV
jgi:hypothetical protein